MDGIQSVNQSVGHPPQNFQNQDRGGVEQKSVRNFEAFGLNMSEAESDTGSECGEHRSDGISDAFETGGRDGDNIPPAKRYRGQGRNPRAAQLASTGK